MKAPIFLYPEGTFSYRGPNRVSCHMRGMDVTMAVALLCALFLTQDCFDRECTIVPLYDGHHLLMEGCESYDISNFAHDVCEMTGCDVCYYDDFVEEVVRIPFQREARDG